MQTKSTYDDDVLSNDIESLTENNKISNSYTLSCDKEKYYNKYMKYKQKYIKLSKKLYILSS